MCEQNPAIQKDKKEKTENSQIYNIRNEKQAITIDAIDNFKIVRKCCDKYTKTWKA